MNSRDQMVRERRLTAVNKIIDTGKSFVADCTFEDYQQHSRPTRDACEMVVIKAGILLKKLRDQGTFTSGLADTVIQLGARFEKVYTDELAAEESWNAVKLLLPRLQEELNSMG